MKSFKKFWSYSAWILIVFTIGVGLFSFAFEGGMFVARVIEKNTRTNLAQAVSPENTTTDITVEPEKSIPFKIILGNVSDNTFTPPPEGKVIRTNLETMQIKLYDNGALIDTIPIAAKGKEGTFYQTPGGEYQVMLKERNHFSSIGKVWMPYSMQFFGNYFIHGWPYYPDGTPVASSFSGGCIRLKDEDAKKIYEWADTHTLVSVYSDSDTTPKKTTKDSSYYLINKNLTPQISADAYLVGDLDTGEILLEKNQNNILPIASVSKLITALVSMDTVNQLSTVTVSKNALTADGDSGALVAGEKVKAADLLYALILESSNDAAEVLAENIGRSNFIKYMNAKATAVGMGYTYFEDPSGLSENNVSTAVDLFKLARYIKKYKPFLFDLSVAREFKTDYHHWYNHSQFIDQEEYTGGKNGFINASKETEIATFKLPLSEFDNRNIGIVLLKSDNRYNDTEKILNYIKQNIFYGPGENKTI